MITAAPPRFADRFTAVRGYLAAATAGLPARETAASVRTHIAEWEQGRLDPLRLSQQLEACRGHFAAIAGVPPDRVGIGAQTSQLVSVIGTGVPDGSEVLCAAGDFASLAHPFEQLAGRGITVRYAPLAELAGEITPRTSLVAFSLVQSATGEIADHRAIVREAAAAGARTCADLTQSLGWYPVGAAEFDFAVCHAYKWLCAPRGLAFLSVREALDETLAPLAAGWYSAGDPWGSCYADHMPLAPDAGRFDLSPAWPAVAGAEAALRHVAGLDLSAVERHDVGLANAARAVLGLEPGGSAIVAWADPDGRDLGAMRTAGLVAAGRAGNARISFHLWNTEEDVELLAAALGR
ncbi:aminotransferase class V-fold PLP-dependent enzyme [Leucobacter weissii]|uniref:Aminotransferase class V-fold PLP-dependent enzyme n=1 Tax=Leucobacter weissii TaxID=1983706 RepID=A0A939MNG2_9MICO|nr:aminotransferase class V-fold PLP-dependent enzyme [Leucobacter weissii]MBO1902042.1 aminotransferase class V-fold PLP-dependent enzyme [Leucobacter weissii]